MLPLLTATFLLAAPLAPPGPAQTWVDLAGLGEPGAEPTVEVVAALSGPGQTVLEVTIPGFLAEVTGTSVGTDYTRLSLPASASVTEDLGAPELPVLRFHLAAPPGATAFFHEPWLADPSLVPKTAVLTPPELVGLPKGKPAPQIFPVHEPAWDGDAEHPGGVPEKYHYDKTAYVGTGLYPATSWDTVVPVEPLLGGLSGVLLELRPFRWNKQTQSLEVRWQFQVGFLHPPGPPFVAAPGSPDARHLALQLALNAAEVGATYPTNSQTYEGRYLIVTDIQYLEELLPFVQYRQLTGYDVQVRLLHALPDTSCASIRAAIGQWYAAGAPGTDHYCLLVGDVAELPLCPASTTDATLGDDLYGSPFDGDLYEEVYVGRLSVDGEADLELQLAKIMSYERDFSSGLDYGDIVIAAHLQDSPGKYEGLALQVIEQLHDDSPEAETQFVPGSFNGFLSDLKVAEYVDERAGYLLYRGHGTSASWIDWNWQGTSFDDADIDGLSNGQYPIHWSITCANGDLPYGDCIAERWMESNHGASAVFAAVRGTSTTPNHELARHLATGVFSVARMPHGMLIAWAEAATEALFHGEYTEPMAWRYLLLGDPAMVCRTEDEAPEPQVDVPDALQVDANGDGTLEVGVFDLAGQGQDGVLVSVLVGESQLGPNWDLVPPAFQADAYTAQGQVVFPIHVPTSKLAGAKSARIGLRLPSGAVQTFEVPIQVGSFADLGGAVANSEGEAPSLSCDDDLVAGQKFELLLAGAPAKKLGVLFLALADNPVPFETGEFHPLPVFQSKAFQTSVLGQHAFVEGPVPAGLPKGLEVVYQAAVLDPLGPGGIVLTNALKAVL
ncbi:MAG TPA: C25 family cysteine peptidase [Planctomycetota bacterium]|nr:C25 family cysteine peptidase [Planctomycetota bacterium]